MAVINLTRDNFEKEVAEGTVLVDFCAARFDVMSIPTLIVFKDGKEVKRSIGIVPKEEIVKMLG